MKNYPVVISCDWFAYSCSNQGGHDVNLHDTFHDPISAATFTIDATTEHHPFYESAFLAREGNAPVAHIFTNCKRGDQPFSCQIKVDNSRLYFARWAESVTALIRALRWRVVYVNRIDICADFNYFANGRLPLLFAQDYLSRPSKNRPSFIRHSSNKLRAVVTRTLHDLNYETLSWGTRDSAVQVNLYNKSLELREKTDKPWIRKRWIEAGLLHDSNGAEKLPVWRVEFSINPAALMVKKKSSQEVVGSLNINHVATPAALIETWSLLHPRYFTFHFLTAEAARNPKVRVRDLPVVDLFQRSDLVPYEVKNVRYFRKSTRTDRLLLKRLQTQLEDVQLDAGEKQAFRMVVSKLNDVLQLRETEVLKDNLTSDVLDDYLMSCFVQHCPPDYSAVHTQLKEWKRRARMWTRMLQCTRDEDLEKFADALRQLEELSGTDAFEQCLKYANYVAGGLMPDEVISDMVDTDVLDSCLPTLNSAYYPVEDGFE